MLARTRVCVCVCVCVRLYVCVCVSNTPAGVASRSGGSAAGGPLPQRLLSQQPLLSHPVNVCVCACVHEHARSARLSPTPLPCHWIMFFFCLNLD